MANQFSSTLGGAASGAAAGTSILPGWGTAIGAGIGGLMGLFGGGSDEEEQAKAARAAALQQYSGIHIPTAQEQAIALQTEQLAGQLTPEQQTAIGLGPSAMEGISTDPRLRQAQMSALQSMAERGKTGLTAEDRVALMEAQRGAGAEAAAAQASAMQNLAARGMAGGGAELAARLAASQAAGNRASDDAMKIAAQAQRNALEATAQAGSMAGQQEAQQFGEKSQIASAQDIINKFNVQNRQATQAANIQARNQAQAANLAAKQAVMNQNVATANTQETYNKQLLDKYYQQQMEMAGAKAGIYGGQATAAQRASETAAGQTAGMLQGLGTIAGSFAKAKTPAKTQDFGTGDTPSEGYQTQQEKKKGPFDLG